MVSFDNFSDVLTVAELAQLLNISTRSAYQLLHSGEIRYRKIGRIYRISKQEVFDYLLRI